MSEVDLAKEWKSDGDGEALYWESPANAAGWHEQVDVLQIDPRDYPVGTRIEIHTPALNTAAEPPHAQGSLEQPAPSTPAPPAASQGDCGERKYPNVGSGCDLGRYRTGEVPLKGDRVKRNRQRLAGDENRAVGREPHEFNVRSVWFAADGSSASVSNREHDTGGWLAPRFDLIRRKAPAAPDLVSRAPAPDTPAAPSVAEPAAEEGEVCEECGGCGEVDYMTIVGERRTSCPSCHQAAPASPAKEPAAVGGVMGAPITEDNIPEHWEIRRAGTYDTTAYRMRKSNDNLAHVHKLVSLPDGTLRWLGMFGDSPELWNPENGVGDYCVNSDITGPVADPPETPVLTFSKLDDLPELTEPMKVRMNAMPADIVDQLWNQTESKSWTPGEVITVPAYSGGFRVWRVTGVHLGALHQESVIELETLDRRPSTEGRILVPMELLDLVTQVNAAGSGKVRT